MTDPIPIENAVGRVERCQCPIHESCLARTRAQLAVQAKGDEIDRTRRVSQAMADLALLIEGMDDVRAASTQRSYVASRDI
jgi:Cu/Ag efflux pump CusA